MTAARAALVAAVIVAMAFTAAVALASPAPRVATANDGGFGAAGALPGGGALIGSGGQLLSGNLGAATSTVLGTGPGGALAGAGASIALGAIGAAAVSAATVVLHQAAAALGATSTPQLKSTWFSATYWRMAAIATVLTLPFLFAATVQAALQSDVTLLARSALGYLPLAMLAIAIAAPLTRLLLAASDELCGVISAAAGNESVHVLAYASVLAGGLTAFGQSPFLAFLIALFAIAAAFALWIELLLREAAVYVVVLMLPLAFAALAWPARRIWAVRAVEILVALVLSKFAIVAVLSLGGAAIAASIGHAGISGLMAGTVLILLSAASPWALLRFVPLAEVAAGTAGALRGELRAATAATRPERGYARSAAESVIRRAAEMNRDAASQMPEAPEPPPPASPPQPEAPQPEAPQPDAPTAEVPPTRERRWSERSTLELGPNYRDTPAWPHEDAG